MTSKILVDFLVIEITDQSEFFRSQHFDFI